MTRPTRRPSRAQPWGAAAATLLGALLLLPALPGEAQAHHRHRELRTHHHTAERAWSRWFPHRSWRRARHRHEHRASYYCARCHHDFHRRHRFFEHLHHGHYVPWTRLPFVVVHTWFGWMFYG